MRRDWKLISDIKPTAIERGWNYQAHHPAMIQRFEPSKTIPDVVTEVLENWQRWLDENYERDRHPANGVIRQLTRLYGVATVAYPESFTCEIPQALIMGENGIVSTMQGEALVQSLFYLGLAEMKLLLLKATHASDEPPVLPGTYMTLRAPWDHNYLHWLLNCASRLALVDYTDPALKFILPLHPAKFHIECLKLLGISEDRMISVDEPVIAVEKLLFSCLTPKTNLPTPAPFLDIIEQLKRGAGVSSSVISDQRLYISRSHSARPVVNEAELEGVLTDFGFRIIYPQQYSVGEQIQLFSQANVLLGPHGAGMIGHVYCPPGSTVIELFNEGYWHMVPFRPCSYLGHKHWHMFGQNLSPTYHTWIDPERLRQLLTVALATP